MKIEKRRRTVQLGPFHGGINFRDSWTDLADDELAYAVNIDIDVNGKLQSRPPLFHTIASEWPTTLSYVGGVMTPGYMVWIMYKAANDGIQLHTRTVEASTGNWVAKVSPVTAGYKNAWFGVYYKGYLYFGLQSATAGVGKIAKVLLNDVSTVGGANAWSLINGPAPIGGDLLTGTIHSDRLFVTETTTFNRVYYSKPTDFNVWADPDGGLFDVGEADDRINKIISLNNRLYIFKGQSIWTLDYVNDPVDDGTLQMISATTGAENAIAYKNRIFGSNRSGVFELVGGQIYWLSDKLGLRENINRDAVTGDAAVNNYLKGSNQGNHTLAASDDKLYLTGWELVSGFNPGFNTIKPLFVLDLQTGAWTMYTNDRVEPGETTHCTIEGPVYANEEKGAIHARSLTTDAPITILTRQGQTDRDRIGVNGPPFAKFCTKEYDFGEKVNMKRLFRAYLHLQNFWWDDNNNVFTVGYKFMSLFYENLSQSIVSNITINAQPSQHDKVYEGVWHSLRTRFRHLRMEVELNTNELYNTTSGTIKSYHWEIPSTELEIDDRSRETTHVPSQTFAPG